MTVLHVFEKELASGRPQSSIHPDLAFSGASTPHHRSETSDLPGAWWWDTSSAWKNRTPATKCGWSGCASRQSHLERFASRKWPPGRV